MAVLPSQIRKFLADLEREFKKGTDVEHIAFGKLPSLSWMRLYVWAADSYVDAPPERSPMPGSSLFLQALNHSSPTTLLRFQCRFTDRGLSFADFGTECEVTLQAPGELESERYASPSVRAVTLADGEVARNLEETLDLAADGSLEDESSSPGHSWPVFNTRLRFRY